MGFLAQHMPTCVDRSMDANNSQKNVIVKKNVLPPLISSPAKQNGTDEVFGTTQHLPTCIDRSMHAHDKTTNHLVLILIMMIMTETT